MLEGKTQRVQLSFYIISFGTNGIFKHNKPSFRIPTNDILKTTHWFLINVDGKNQNLQLIRSVKRNGNSRHFRLSFGAANFYPLWLLRFPDKCDLLQDFFRHIDATSYCNNTFTRSDKPRKLNVKTTILYGSISREGIFFFFNFFREIFE